MKKKVKICIIICIFLCTSCITSLSEDASLLSFETALTSAIATNTSANSIFATSSNRAIITISLYMDLAATTLDILNEKVDYLFSNDSFVGLTDDGGLTVLFYDDENIYTIWYSPISPNIGFYTVIDRSQLIDSSIELGVKIANKEYHKNTLSDLINATNAIVSIIQ